MFKKERIKKQKNMLIDEVTYLLKNKKITSACVLILFEHEYFLNP